MISKIILESVSTVLFGVQNSKNFDKLLLDTDKPLDHSAFIYRWVALCLRQRGQVILNKRHQCCKNNPLTESEIHNLIAIAWSKLLFQSPAFYPWTVCWVRSVPRSRIWSSKETTCHFERRYCAWFDDAPETFPRRIQPQIHNQWSTKAIECYGMTDSSQSTAVFHLNDLSKFYVPNE